jgi:hypothetical protein
MKSSYRHDTWFKNWVLFGFIEFKAWSDQDFSEDDNLLLISVSINSRNLKMQNFIFHI